MNFFIKLFINFNFNINIIKKINNFLSIITKKINKKKQKYFKFNLIFLFKLFILKFIQKKLNIFLLKFLYKNNENNLFKN